MIRVPFLTRRIENQMDILNQMNALNQMNTRVPKLKFSLNSLGVQVFFFLKILLKLEILLKPQL